MPYGAPDLVGYFTCRQGVNTLLYEIIGCKKYLGENTVFVFNAKFGIIKFWFDDERLCRATSGFLRNCQIHL